MGFSDEAILDDRAMSPISFPLNALTVAREKKIGALVKKSRDAAIGQVGTQQTQGTTTPAPA